MTKNRVISNTFWIVSGQIIQMAISFLITMFTVRYLGPDRYGLLNYSASYLSFISAFCTLGLNNIIVTEIIKNKNYEGEIIGTCLILRFISSIISVICIIIIVAITNQFDQILILVSILQAINLIFEASTFLTCWFESRLISKYVSIVKVIACIIAAGYKILILVCNKSIFWFAFSSSVEMILICILLFTIYKRNSGPPLSFSTSCAIKLMNKSKHYIMSGLMISLYSQMDKLMIGKIIDTTAVGLYSAAVYICNLWSFIPNAIIDSARPAITEQFYDKKKFVASLTKMYACIIWLGIAFSIIVAIFGKIIILILYGKSYLGSLSSFQIIAWTSVFSYLSAARSIWIVNEQKYRYENIISLIGFFVNLVLNFIFITKFGIVGAAVATLLTQILTNVVMQLSIKDLRPNGKIILNAFILRGIFPTKSHHTD